ncbi:Phosphatidate cytidylyltransferase [Phytophthora megakarya]|uniref:Phosphatidate cytidylyltransferase n=1 Tax=Phytophthora megakarya TaxID=4795 RepID=A0A225UYU8_9STRA|nr:Phosphatidate cytidylyltransferase [Phytophthora megakarya]
MGWGRRVLTGLVGIPTALWLLSSDVGMLLLATMLCCLSLVEFTAICPQIVPQSKSAMVTFVHQLLVVTLGAVLCFGAWTGDKLIHDALNLSVTLTIFVFHIATTKKMDQTALINLLLDLFALMYVVNGFSYAILLRYSSSKFGLGLQILGLCCAWVCDSGALVAGSFMGHAKLAPVVSPGKTLVGAIAGVLSSVATVLVMFALPQLATVLPVVGQWTQNLLPPLDVVPFAHQIVLGFVLGVLCIVGDLVESYVKRVAGVKDSGAFFPGHGGCLDRMDSFLFVAPCLYYYSQFALPK